MDINPEYIAYGIAICAVLAIVSKFTKNKVDDIIVKAATSALIELQKREAATKPKENTNG